jgi:hypothetical protein
MSNSQPSVSANKLVLIFAFAACMGSASLWSHWKTIDSNLAGGLVLGLVYLLPGFWLAGQAARIFAPIHRLPYLWPVVAGFLGLWVCAFLMEVIKLYPSDMFHPNNIRGRMVSSELLQPAVVGVLIAYLVMFLTKVRVTRFPEAQWMRTCMALFLYSFWLSLLTLMITPLRAMQLDPWIISLCFWLFVCFAIGVAPLLRIWPQQDFRPKLRIAALLGMQFIPVIANESFFRPEELRFIARVESGDVEMTEWGFTVASESRRAPFDSLTLEWDEDCGYLVMD